MKNPFKKEYIAVAYSKTLSDVQKDVLDNLDLFLSSTFCKGDPSDPLYLVRIQVEHAVTLKGSAVVSSNVKDQIAQMQITGFYIPRTIAFIGNADWEFVIGFRGGPQLDPSTRILFNTVMNQTDSARLT